jgi:RimJ/RimL family protein N-acetyltransferase
VPAPLLPLQLHTDRLLLRQWQADDAHALAEIYAQPQYLEHMPRLDLEQAGLQIEVFQRRWQEDGYSQWAAESLESGRLIGRIGLLCRNDWPLIEGPVPEVGWVLHPDFWGRGLATEGGRASLSVWLEHLDDPRLISITTPRNVRSRAVMERLGLTYGGTAHWHGFDVVWYGTDRPAA